MRRTLPHRSAQRRGSLARIRRAPSAECLHRGLGFARASVSAIPRNGCQLAWAKKAPPQGGCAIDVEMHVAGVVAAVVARQMQSHPEAEVWETHKGHHSQQQAPSVYQVASSRVEHKVRLS